MTHVPTFSRSHGLRLVLVLVAISCGEVHAFAEPIAFTVTETAGLRRFGYPVTAALEAPAGAIAGVGMVRLVDASGKEVAAQFTAMSQWGDGSVRLLDVDFVSGLGPLESQAFRVMPGAGPERALPKGLSVVESAEEITVASSAISHRIRRDGKPLLSSIAFGKLEFLAKGGVTTTISPGPAEVLKRGPFNVTLKFGEVRLEYVSSKSWVKITQRANSPADLAVNAHFALSEQPLTWDFGVGSWLYGTLKPGQSALLRQGPTEWKVFLESAGQPSALFATGRTCEGWGHFADEDRVVAFGAEGGDAESERTFQLSSDGQVRTAVRGRELSVYFHVVGQPVQVTAVTSPASMLSPLKVTVSGMR